MSRGVLREYVRGSLWVLPTLSVLAALVAGTALASVSIGSRSPLAFQGTPDDARTLLLGITGTMVTVIALLLGLAVVALQLSSTQFSPRLLRNFLRDRPNQVVLSAFVATFAYSAAGLYTVGVSGGDRTAAFPRLAVSGAIVLLFVSLLVFFADHLVHSIQVDAIMEAVQRNTLAVIRGGLLTGGPPRAGLGRPQAPQCLTGAQAGIPDRSPRAGRCAAGPRSGPGDGGDAAAPGTSLRPPERDRPDGGHHLAMRPGSACSPSLAPWLVPAKGVCPSEPDNLRVA
ncbi:MAG: DUF2254 family protein [Streptosporangiaceae bacterium]